MSKVVALTVLCAPCAVTPLHAAALPDTGMLSCFTDTGQDPAVFPFDANSVSRDNGTHPRQDCRYGRDPAESLGAFVKIGGGHYGLDYTKIGNDGSDRTQSATLGTTTTSWGCTRDNVTGLVWEVKTANSGDARYAYHRYTWYDGENGVAGDASTCGATLSNCNTAAYVAAMNSARLCSFSDWRLPSPRELLTINDLADAGLDTNFFPNLPQLTFVYWTNTRIGLASFPDGVWGVYTSGASHVASWTLPAFVRLVRGPRF